VLGLVGVIGALYVLTAAAVPFVPRHLTPDCSGEFQPLFVVAWVTQTSRVGRVEWSGRAQFFVIVGVRTGLPIVVGVLHSESLMIY
jgi:hypothetical protein